MLGSLEKDTTALETFWDKETKVPELRMSVFMLHTISHLIAIFKI